MDENWKEEVLRNITRYGSTGEDTAAVIPVLATRQHANSLLTISSGLPRIHKHIIPKFKLVMSLPEVLEDWNQLEIRCCLCGYVIAFPAWYLSVKYIKTHMHFFICSRINQGIKEDKVTSNCLRRG